jgi:hypothetical protein
MTLSATAGLLAHASATTVGRQADSGRSTTGGKECHPSPRDHHDQVEPLDQDQPPGELARFVTSYTQAWNTGDLDGIVGAYATPCLVVTGGQVLRQEDDRAKHRYFGDLLAGNRRQGPHRWSVAELDPRPLGRDAALVTVRWTCRPDGSTTWELLDSYLLAAEDGRGRILGDVVHD